MSPLAMAEWIEIEDRGFLCESGKSPLAMAEWIEIVVLIFPSLSR